MNMCGRLNPQSYIRAGLLLLLLIGGCCMTAALFLSLGKLSTLYQQAAEIRATMTEWQEQAAFINNQTYRPVLSEQIEAVSSDILFAVQAHQLELVSYQSLHSSGEEEAPFQTFTLSVKGAYANNITFLEDFRAKDALVSIMSIKMYPVDGYVQTDLRCRIYTK